MTTEATEDNLAELKNSSDKKSHSHCCVCSCCLSLLYWTGCKCCCCDSDNLDSYGLDHIVHQRHCTDVPLLILFIFTLLIDFALLLTAIDLNADPRWLVYYCDWEGNICAPGESHGIYAAWPDIRMYDIVICINECNETLTDSRVITPNFDILLDDIDSYLDDFDNSSTVETTSIEGYKTVNIFNAYCIPNFDSLSDIIDITLSEEYSTFLNEFKDTIDAFGEMISLAIDDLYVVRYVLIVSAFTALLTSILWGWFIRYFGGIIVWASICFTLFGIVCISYYMIDFSETAYTFGYDNIGDVMYYGGISLAVLDGCFFFAICFMWHRIRLAIALAKETTRALNEMWGMFFYPIVPSLVFVFYSIYWAVGALYMASVTDVISQDMPDGIYSSYYEDGPTLYESLGEPSATIYKKYSINEDWQYVLLFHFFVLLWVIQAISYHTYLVLCGVYAEWYFAEWKDYPNDTKKLRTNSKNLSSRALSKHPILSSLKRTTMYHFGTIAFGALLIAIIEFIEYTLTYFEKRFTTDEPSPLQTCLLALIKCLLKCLKCILDRISKNGYVICAITGWPFCASSIKGVNIIFHNIVRSAMLDLVSGYLEKLGKVAIISLNTGIIMIFIFYIYGDNISSIFLPCIFVILISYSICFQYMHLYEVGLHTVFICFLIDESVNKNKLFKDENNNIIIHPKTGQPIGKMRASWRLYKLIGLKKPKIRATKEQIKHARNTSRIGSNDLTNDKNGMMNEVDLQKAMRMLQVDASSDEDFYYGDDHDEHDEAQRRTFLHNNDNNNNLNNVSANIEMQHRLSVNNQNNNHNNNNNRSHQSHHR